MRERIKRYRVGILLGLSLLLPFCASEGSGLEGLATSALSLFLPEASATTDEEDPWRLAYYRLIEENARLRARLLALGEPARLVAHDPAYWERNPVRIEAAVLGKDASPWRGSLIVSAGERAGVRNGMPVVVGRVLVGLVATTGPVTSQVRLLTDPGERIWTMILSGGETTEGYVAGTGSPKLAMGLVKAGAGKAGDPVFTAGGSALIPRGLLVGEIASIGDADRDGLAEVEVRPMLEASEVRFVNILAVED